MDWALRGGRADWPQLAALGYALGVTAAAIGGLLSGTMLLQGIACLALAHSLVVAAYLIHECAHNSIFVSQAANRRLGAVLSWMVGASYGRYDDIRRKHLRHHSERADVIAYDYRALLLRHPGWLRAVQLAEWAYIPAVDLLMHALVIVLPFTSPKRRDRRTRVLVNLVVRGSLFVGMAWITPTAPLYYALAYLLFLHALRFMDVHQHTYAVLTTLDDGTPQRPAGDRAYEQRNTYSNPLAPTHPWIDRLMLNFGYHNAHHIHPSTPWHALPALHRAQPGSTPDHVLPFAALLRSYHRHRVARVLNGDAPDHAIGAPQDFIGVLGVSFLTAH
ncbi:fatty acid desaturase [Sinimarinibacterium sp. CAU 1509]|uniref:fatty acid desaturase family protein n=1 Tax=Sinimarinibacterium sp. CAU 1509 TaxID=2562283 RepID=UPI0010AD21D8|nr:fatty acid desaturase [Sinimarinibacterium sp. CAU 1509]TJY58377.1 fatty acid desaturase [Sinimarinibacterium sp. CAU 1509]